jgi:hypothetical protein
MKLGQPESIAVLRKVMEDECGVKWDGAGRLVDAIIVEQKRLAAITKAKAQITAKILALDAARLRLERSAIAGKAGVEAAIAVVNEIVVPE